MPIYEYVCGDCRTRFERVVMSSGQKISCPHCAGERHTLQLSVFSAGKSSTGVKSADAASCSPSSGFCGCTPNGCGFN